MSDSENNNGGERVTIQEIIERAIRVSQDQLVTAATKAAVSAVEITLGKRSADITSEAVQQSVKKLKTELPTFKKKGNQDQYYFNYDIESILDKALKANKDGNTKLVDETLQEGKNLLVKRQKLIKLADREQDGWHMIKEYVSDDLASNSEDEKNINRARKNAASKRKKKTAFC